PWIEQAGDGPRLVVEWPGDGPVQRFAAQGGSTAAAQPAGGTAAAAVSTDAAVAGKEVSPIDVAASAAATSRLISELTAKAAAREVENRQASVPAQPAPEPAAVPPVTAPATQPPPRPTLPGEAGMRPLVIAIDPGHGGQDPGAIGKNGTREEDVVLAISKELARQIDATPGLKSFLTRDNDVFIPLNQRARL